MTDTETNAIALPEQTSLVALFKSDDEMGKLIDRLEQQVREEAKTHDVSTPAGRKALVSLAYKVSQSKAELDRQGKALTERQRAAINAVNATRSKAQDRLEKLRDQTRKPVSDWEAAEEARKQRHRDALQAFDLGRVDANCAVNMIRDVIREVEARTTTDAWEEFQSAAETAKDAALRKFRTDLSIAEEREAQAAELERLRAEAAERERREAEERAKREAEERQREAAERAIREAEEAEKRAQEEKARRAQELAEAAERAAQEVKESAAREAREAEERHQRELAEEKAKAERAAADERARVAKEAEERRVAVEKRAADEAHRASILADIKSALEPIPRESIAQALMDGRIPHVTVNL